MLGRKDFTREEVDQAKAAVAAQIATYKALAKVGTDKKVDAALDRLEPIYFNGMLLALDRCFVHRVRMVTGKDGNPLNEVELLADSLMSNGGVFQDNSVIKYVPEQSVLKLQTGDRIHLSVDQFESLAAAFFADLERKFT